MAVPAWPTNSTACASMPSHCSATPEHRLPYLPQSPFVQLSAQQVANRYST
jgi:hypothetical protein